MTVNPIRTARRSASEKRRSARTSRLAKIRKSRQSAKVKAATEEEKVSCIDDDDDDARKAYKEHHGDSPRKLENLKDTADFAADTDAVICKAIAQYDYEANGDDELSFKEGDVIEVTEMDDEDGWWHGKLKDKFGAFPYNYVFLTLNHDGVDYMLTTEEKELYGLEDGELKGKYDLETKTFTGIDEDGLIDDENTEVWENSSLK